MSVSDTTVSCTCSCDYEISATTDHEWVSGVFALSDLEFGHFGTRPVFRDDSAKAWNGQETIVSSARTNDPDLAFKIRPSDFYEINRSLGVGLCHCCEYE